MISKVVVDADPARGWRGDGRDMVRVWVVRSLQRGAPLGLLGAVVLGALGPMDRFPGVLAIAGLGTIGALLLVYGMLLLQSVGIVRGIASRYGVVIKPGIYTSQHRRIEVHAPPPDLTEILERVISSIGADAGRIAWLNDQRMVAVIPRIGRNWMSCRATVDLRRCEARDVVAVEFQTDMAEWLGIVDLGRNLIVAEEFQRRLKRVVEEGVLAEAYDWGSGYEPVW